MIIYSAQGTLYAIEPPLHMPAHLKSVKYVAVNGVGSNIQGEIAKRKQEKEECLLKFLL